MKTFGGEPEGRVLRAKMQLHFSWLSPDPAREEGPGGAWPVSVHQRLCHTSLNQQPSPFKQSRLCVQSASSSNSVSVGLEKSFASTYVPSPFLKMDLNQDASRGTGTK